MTINLRLRTGSKSHVIDFRRVNWDSLATRELASIRNQPIEVDRVQCCFDDHFEISALPDRRVTNDCTEDSSGLLGQRLKQADFVLEGDFSKSIGLGSEMARASIIVHGNAGAYAGSHLNGGKLLVVGNAGAHLGHSMALGSIFILGDAGDDLASPQVGKRSGMRGGTLIVLGDVGHRPGHKMRRGTIAVAGNCGDYCLHGMIAGTFVGLQQIGADWGVGMKRGTIILGSNQAGRTKALLTEKRAVQLSFLTLLWRHLHQVECDARTCLEEAAINTPKTDREAVDWSLKGIRSLRQLGDISVGGKGEVLTLL